eukprot:8331663-Alexandrium_andersonii.AAC.1
MCIRDRSETRAGSACACRVVLRMAHAGWCESPPDGPARPRSYCVALEPSAAMRLSLIHI